MDISIIILTKNQKDLVIQSIPKLLSQKTNYTYEIIVIDSGSTDGAVEYLKSQPIKLFQIPPHMFHYAKTFNFGLKMSHGKYVLRLSGDVIPLNDDFLDQLVKPFEDETVGAVYAKYTITGREGYSYPGYWNEKRFPKDIAKYHLDVKWHTCLSWWGKENEIATNLAGGAMMIKGNLLRSRPMCEGLIAGEDAEYGWFLHLIGYDIVCNPFATVLHEHKISTNQTFWNQAKHPINTFKWKVGWPKHLLGYWLRRLVGIDIYKQFRR